MDSGNESDAAGAADPISILHQTLQLATALGAALTDAKEKRAAAKKRAAAARAHRFRAPLNQREP
jgi:hypothetical protein